MIPTIGNNIFAGVTFGAARRQARKAAPVKRAKTTPEPFGRFSMKRLLVAVTGGIAAYKAADVVRMLQQQGAKGVRAMMTADAQKFLGPLTLASLTRQPVLTKNMETTADGTPTHIAMAQEMDGMLIVPATANTLAKLASGASDNIVTTTAITFTDKPVVIAPAMNTRMWRNPIVQDNVAKLQQLLPNVTVIPPESGPLACGETGDGKLPGLETLSLYFYRATHPYKDLYKGKTVVVTTGGTHEPIDSVRIITNKSSGKMGLAIADELFAMGANVILIHTLDADLGKPYETVKVKSVNEMGAATKKAFAKADGLIMAAAVSDFTVDNPPQKKIKKQPKMTLDLTKTHDFLVEIGHAKKPEQFVVGFAAESEDLAKNAQGKLERKNLDMIVGNDISKPGIGFVSDENEVTLLFRNHAPVHLPRAHKSLIARELLAACHQHVVSKK